MSLLVVRVGGFWFNVVRCLCLLLVVAVGCRLLLFVVAVGWYGCLLQVVNAVVVGRRCYWLLFAVVGCWLLLFVVCCLLFVLFWLLVVGCCLLFGVCWSSIAFGC